MRAMEQPNINQSAGADTGIFSLQRQFQEMEELNAAMKCVKLDLHSVNTILQFLSTNGVSVTKRGELTSVVGLVKVDMSLLEKGLKALTRCLNRRSQGVLTIEVESTENDISLVIPTYDSSVIENSIVATYAVEVIEKMGAKAHLKKEAITLTFPMSKGQ